MGESRELITDPGIKTDLARYAKIARETSRKQIEEEIGRAGKRTVFTSLDHLIFGAAVHWFEAEAAGRPHIPGTEIVAYMWARAGADFSQDELDKTVVDYMDRRVPRWLKILCDTSPGMA